MSKCLKTSVCLKQGLLPLLAVSIVLISGCGQKGGGGKPAPIPPTVAQVQQIRDDTHLSPQQKWTKMQQAAGSADAAQRAAQPAATH